MNKASDFIIRVEDLEGRYGETTIFREVNFEVRRGEIFGILGGSGCGKSTLLKILIGLLAPYRGRIWLDGEETTRASHDGMDRVIGKMGVLFQAGALLSSLTIFENVALPILENTELRGALVETMVRMKLQMVSLSGYEDYYPDELSGGMKKRAALARAMALDPQLLFFDEPSAGLDPITAAELDQLILTLNRSLDTTMVIVTHDLDSIFTVIERAIVLDKAAKTIIAAGDPKELREHSENSKVRSFFRREAMQRATVS